jgi:hypothetical protein
VDDSVARPLFPRTLKRTTSYLELQELIEPLINSISLEANQSSAVVTEFIPIKAAEFVSGSKSIFDVFVKLSEKKYVKIVNSGDVFNPQRVNEYISKGVEHFYIPRQSHEAYLLFSDKVAAAVLKKRDMPNDVKSAMTLKAQKMTSSEVSCRTSAHSSTAQESLWWPAF